MVLPKELRDEALVCCQRCNSPVATWAVFKARTTLAILAETGGRCTDPGCLGPDPLDSRLLRAHGSRM